MTTLYNDDEHEGKREYRVEIRTVCIHHVYVNADDAFEARRVAERRLERYGLSNLKGAGWITSSKAVRANG